MIDSRQSKYSSVHHIILIPRGWCRLVGVAHVGRGGRTTRATAIGHGQSVRARRTVPRAEQPALHGALEPRRRHLSGTRTPFPFRSTPLALALHHIRILPY